MGILDAVFYTFTAVVFIQVIFYTFFFGKFAFLKTIKKRRKSIEVSVIVCAKNESENLKEFLPLLLSQDYPSFEIVLINDASYDDTLEIMEAFAEKHFNIKIVDVKNTEAFWGNKKYALTLGIKASKHDYLLFTDADCKPVSKYWIKEMSSHFSAEKSIVLGYGAYSKIKKSFLNKIIRFETLMTAIHYFSFANQGLPYMGVGRNLAYTKDEFFKANGFISHIKVRSGDDDLFINQIASKTNTAICFSNESFTESIPETIFKDWFNQKRRHISTASYYKLKHKILLSIIYLTNFLFWLFAFILLVSLHYWAITLAFFLIKMIFQFAIIGASAKKLNENDLLFLIPFLEIFLIGFQLAIFINNLFSKPNHWK